MALCLGLGWLCLGWQVVMVLMLVLSLLLLLLLLLLFLDVNPAGHTQWRWRWRVMVPCRPSRPSGRPCTSSGATALAAILAVKLLSHK
jgi:hypothetical protein